MIFGMWNHEKIWHENLTDCPPRLSDVATVPWEIEVIFNSIIHTHCRLFTLSHQKTICNPLPTTPENITTLTCKMWNFFIWLLRSFRRWRLWQSQLWVVVGGSEKNQLWCVATGMSGKQCHSKCSVTTFCINICFLSFSTPFSRTLCWNSAHIATSHCRKSQRVRIVTIRTGNYVYNLNSSWQLQSKQRVGKCPGEWQLKIKIKLNKSWRSSADGATRWQRLTAASRRGQTDSPAVHGRIPASDNGWSKVALEV